MPPEDKDTKTDETTLPIELNKSNSDEITYFDPLEISTDNLAEDVNIQYNKDEFIRGLKDSSYACGMYTGLLNSSWSTEDAVSYVFNRMNIENNIRISEISANASIEVSKHVSNAKENSEL